MITTVKEAREATKNMYLKRLEKCAIQKAHSGAVDKIEYEGLKWVASWIGMSAKVNRQNFNGLVKAIKQADKNQSQIEFYVQWK